MRNTPKHPSQPRSATRRRESKTPLPEPSRQADQRWQRTVRYGWDKGGARGGRK